MKTMNLGKPNGPAVTTDWIPSRAVGGVSFQVRMLTRAQLDPATISRWADLEQRALDRNVFLSPYFVLPALKHLTPALEARLVLIEQQEADRIRLVGLGVFERVSATKHFPLPHWKAYRSPHSYLSGLLIDRSCAAAVTGCFLDFFSSPRAGCHGVQFNSLAADGGVYSALRAVGRESSGRWHEHQRTQRAMLIPRGDDDRYLDTHLPASLAKNLRRRRRRLGELGAVQWRMRRGSEVGDDCVEAFLTLENLGWKQAQQSSLRSRPGHEAFFKEMIADLSRLGRAFFTELLVDGEVIASTSNLISGDTGFAFKLGWNPRFAPFGPGILNEVELIRNIPVLLPELGQLDSGAIEGSFIDKLWLGRRTLVSGYYATSAAAQTLLSGIEWLRQIKRRLVPH